MINVYSFNAVTQAMEITKAKRLKVVTCNDSPVDLLNRAASGPSVLNAAITDDEFYHRLPEELKIGAILGEAKEVAFVKDGAATSLVPLSEHEMTLSELVKLATSRIAGLLDFSRNVAQPFVRTVIEQLNDPAREEVTEEWALVPVALDPLFDAPVVQGLLRTVVDPSRVSYEYERLEGMNVPEDLPVPVTGSKAFDDVLATLLNDLQTTPAQLMRGAIEGTGVNPYRPEAFRTVKEHVATLLLSAFYAENPWGDSGISSTKWDLYLQRMNGGQIAWLMSYLTQLNTRIQAGNTVLSIDGTSMSAFVCQEVFATYVEKGGCAEALLGAIYLQEAQDGGEVSTNIDYLLTNQDTLVGAWSRRSAVQKAALDTDWVNTHRVNLKNSFYQQINTVDAALLGRPQEEARKMAAQAIDMCFGRQVEDITAFVIDIASKEVFNDATVGRILWLSIVV